MIITDPGGEGVVKLSVKLTETDIMRQIREYLQWHGWYVIRNQQSLGSHPGLSDLTAIRAGRVLWIEVKTAKGKLSKAQEKFKQCIEMAGGEFVLARSIEDIEQYLRGAKAG